MSRSSDEDAAYSRAFYPGTQVLVNKLGMRNLGHLDDAERFFVGQRIEQGLPKAALQADQYQGFKAIHRHLFQDVYAWAGKERNYTTGRGAAPFAVPQFIAPSMERLFEGYRKDNRFAGLDPKAFAAKAAEMVNEINAVHPFIDGNGRTQRTWLRIASESVGFRLTIRDEDSARWNEASKVGFVTSNHAPMAELIEERIEAITPERQEGRGKGGRLAAADRYKRILRDKGRDGR